MANIRKAEGLAIYQNQTDNGVLIVYRDCETKEIHEVELMYRGDNEAFLETLKRTIMKVRIGRDIEIDMKSVKQQEKEDDEW